MTENDVALDWLLEGDPAIRWQVMRDLLGSPPGEVERERARVARGGWGKRLLALQDTAGTWGGGLYDPKWISTTYTMLLLRDLGLPPGGRRTRRACALLLDQGLRRDGGIGYGRKDRSETCITGMVLSILAYFEHDDDRLELVADHLLERQMPDGGWNCRLPDATHASVHTTISALEALELYQRKRGRKALAVRAAQRRGREFLLEHRLFRSHRTGEIIKPVFLRFSFPPRWHYDVLRALDHFRLVNAERDPRLAEAIDLVRRARMEDGRWKLGHVYRARTFFEMERLGQPSRWNTLRARRVLDWWDAGGPVTSTRSRSPRARAAAERTRRVTR
jgi:hypothetical protein